MTGALQPPFEHVHASAMNPHLRTFIDRVVVPALLERFLREHAAATQDQIAARPVA